jgi:hypothetical protein
VLKISSSYAQLVQEQTDTTPLKYQPTNLQNIL